MKYKDGKWSHVDEDFVITIDDQVLSISIKGREFHREDLSTATMLLEEYSFLKIPNDRGWYVLGIPYHDKILFIDSSKETVTEYRVEEGNRSETPSAFADDDFRSDRSFGASLAFRGSNELLVSAPRLVHDGGFVTGAIAIYHVLDEGGLFKHRLWTPRQPGMEGFGSYLQHLDYTFFTFYTGGRTFLGIETIEGRKAMLEFTTHLPVPGEGIESLRMIVERVESLKVFDVTFTYFVKGELKNIKKKISRKGTVWFIEREGNEKQ